MRISALSLPLAVLAAPVAQAQQTAAMMRPAQPLAYLCQFDRECRDGECGASDLGLDLEGEIALTDIGVPVIRLNAEGPQGPLHLSGTSRDGVTLLSDLLDERKPSLLTIAADGSARLSTHIAEAGSGTVHALTHVGRCEELH